MLLLLYGGSAQGLDGIRSWIRGRGWDLGSLGWGLGLDLCYSFKEQTSCCKG